MEPRLHFSRAEFDARLAKTRLAKTRRAMEAAGIELLIVSGLSNVAWLTGYDDWARQRIGVEMDDCYFSAKVLPGRARR